jgi:signal transduction histidine kinase/CheY-like chemotaxis protein
MRILIVDDLYDARQVLRYMVENNGHEAIEAENGSDALTIAKSSPPDLIISDALMPVMDGFKFLRAVKQEPELCAIPFVFYSSAYKEDQDIRLAMSLGANAYLFKPMDPVELWEEIESILEKAKQNNQYPTELIEEDAEYLRRYSEVVATKLEEKVLELEKTLAERKLAEERLYESKTTLTTVFDGMSDPLIMLDADLRIKRINKAAKEYYGLISYQEASGKFCYEAFKGRTSLCDGCERCLSTLDGFAGSYERSGEMDRNKLEQVFVDIVRDEVGAPTAYIIRISDITQARMIDRQLIQSEKLASLGLLMAGITHEINNPNNFIYFNAPIMRSYFHFLLPIADEYVAQHPDLKVFGRSYPAFRDDCLELLDNIEYGSTRINQIVGNLREFVRERGQGEIRPIDLKQVVEKAISICKGRIKKQVKTFEVLLPEGPLNLSTDPLAIEQIVVNLLVNAAQAIDKEDSLVRLTIIRPDPSVGNVVVEVSDNGCGMDAEIRRRIFDPFFTTKAVGVGTGLGLSISRRLVTELGGEIEVESEPGKGSIFRVVLPMKSL